MRELRGATFFLTASLVAGASLAADRAAASQIRPLDLAELEKRSAVIVIGQVEIVKAIDEASDDVTVAIAGTLKGSTSAKRFTLRLYNGKSPKAFDPKLRAGDKGVFFLKDVTEGRARLAFWGSVTVFPAGGNFTLGSHWT